MTGALAQVSARILGAIRRCPGSIDAPELPPVAAPAPDAPWAFPLHQPGLLELFLALPRFPRRLFARGLVWARRSIIEQRHWVTPEAFNETFALCHFLPGPNIVNLSVVFGSRFRGVAGAFAAFAGLVGPPMVIATILAALYARYGDVDILRRTLAGVACAAVGLLFAVVLKMMLPLLQRRDVTGLVILAAVFVAIGLIRWPLQIVLLVAIPLSLAITIVTRRMVKS